MSDEIKEEMNSENQNQKRCCYAKIKEIIDSKEVNDLLFIIFGSFLGALLAICFYNTFAPPKYSPAPIVQPCQMMPYEHQQYYDYGEFHEEFDRPDYHEKEFKKHHHG